VDKAAFRATKIMKPERSNEDREALGRVLRAWRVTSPLPPGFAENVWRRIEQAEPATSPASNLMLWAMVKTWLASTLPRPAFAIAYVSVLLIGGLLAGYWRAHVETMSWDKALASRYVQAVDPFHVQAVGPFQKSFRN